jgi:hypothetical protein
MKREDSKKVAVRSYTLGQHLPTQLVPTPPHHKYSVYQSSRLSPQVRQGVKLSPGAEVK